MATPPEDLKLARQRNAFAAGAVLAVLACALGVPGVIRRNRELGALHARTNALQSAILDGQQRIRWTQEQIIGAQQELRDRQRK